MNTRCLTKQFFTCLIFIISLLLTTNTVYANTLLSERTYKRLDRIYKLMDKENYSEALSKLEKLKQSVKNRPYEKALVLQTTGYLYSATNKPAKAIESFKASLELKVMPESVTQNIQLNMTQLYMETDNNTQALVVYKQWLDNKTSPGAAAHILGARLYAKLKDYPNAIHHINAALSATENPQESWYQLILAIYYESKNYQASASLLEQMIVRFPEKKNYWLQLSAIYFTLKQDQKALSVSQLAYSRGLLGTEEEILNLARLYLYMNLPLQAAKLIEKGLANNTVTENKKNLLLLSDSYLQARETILATRYLDKAARLSNDPELLLRLATIEAAQENWPNVIAALDNTDITSLKKPAKAHLLKGIAYFEQNKPDDAIMSFKKAALDNKTQKNAQQWLNLLSQK